MTKPELCEVCGDELVVFGDDFFDAAICKRCECDGYDECDGQPSEYDEWQDFMGGDDWDTGYLEFDEI